jgi:acetate CoA/acetoacetate CoA-transferase beta subunit
MIPDGASLMIGGFMAVGAPERVVTELAVIAFDHGRAHLRETAPGVSVAQIVAATEAELAIPSRVPEMAL